MIVQQEIIGKLRDFGLNSYEAKLWVALLSRGISTAGELSDIANVPRSRSYDVLESLEKKGFIVMKLGKPIKYITIPPSEVLDRVKKRVQIEAKASISQLETLENGPVLQNLQELHTQGIEVIGTSDLSGSLKGRNSIYNHIESLMKNAKSSVHILTTNEGVARKTNQFLQVFQELKKKGVTVNVAAPISEKKDKKILNILSDVASVRYSNRHGRFVVVDEKDVVFMLTDDINVHPSYDSAVWISSPLFASTLAGLYQSEWKTLKQTKNLRK